MTLFDVTCWTACTDNNYAMALLTGIVKLEELCRDLNNYQGIDLIAFMDSDHYICIGRYNEEQLRYTKNIVDYTIEMAALGATAFDSLRH